ncbi:DNA-binding protein [Nocardioides sp. Root190]|uniref:helix-turn-helix domain-containing protein n=1 Tax=Nocardioides sp. Root190 TaxID=1736488 RepID=UPI0006F3E57D|nr:helix-turn-helix domain-containing protein [Nocardioides sp. Root190]KRB77748.1 DNA-binding protein [Nocardioides sp. Root190]
MAKGKVGKTVGSLGDYLKEQRVSSRLSLRQLAEQAGVSNPYLSQIERGLRKPSAEVLQQIAKALRISAEQLYIRAGILSPDDGVGGSVELAILGDAGLTERQKQSLLDVYASFLALNAADAPAGAEESDSGTGVEDDLPVQTEINPDSDNDRVINEG